MTAAYQEAAHAWGSLGWSVVPLPAGGKTYPEAGYTGIRGVDASDEQMQYWVSRQPASNALLRLPDGFVGLDVDDYADKGGGGTWEAHRQAYGELPPTWMVTNRDDGVSGTRLYRTGFDGLYRAELHGGGVDVIHRRHRYVVLPPSLHPSGRRYRLVPPHSLPPSAVPAPHDLPMLPASWEQSLTRPVRRRSKVAAVLDRPPRPSTPAVEPQELQLAALAAELIRSGRAKPIRDAARVTLPELSLILGLSPVRTRHLESGRVRAPRKSLLSRYGAFLQLHSRPVR